MNGLHGNTTVRLTFSVLLLVNIQACSPKLTLVLPPPSCMTMASHLSSHLQSTHHLASLPQSQLAACKTYVEKFRSLGSVKYYYKVLYYWSSCSLE